MKVYIAVRDVHYESTERLGVFESRASAQAALDKEAEGSSAQWYDYIKTDDGSYNGVSASLRIEEEETQP